MKWLLFLYCESCLLELLYRSHHTISVRHNAMKRRHLIWLDTANLCWLYSLHIDGTLFHCVEHEACASAVEETCDTENQSKEKQRYISSIVSRACCAPSAIRDCLALPTWPVQPDYPSPRPTGL